MSESLISSEIDFEAKGKHTGFLRLPHSVHRSAYGRILIPIVMINNGNGPTTLLMAGNHGDEYEAQIALSKLCRELQAKDIQGPPDHFADGEFSGGAGGHAHFPH